jgi:hypothetical protein
VPSRIIFGQSLLTIATGEIGKFYSSVNAEQGLENPRKTILLVALRIVLILELTLSGIVLSAKTSH